MTLPKALLCVLDEHPSAQPPEEAALRAVGFAAATVPWRQTSAQRGWMQLLPILDDPAVQAWVFCGASTDFTPAVLNRMAMLTLALHRPSPPLTACLLTGDGPEPELPHWLGDVRVFRRDKNFAARLMAARLKSRPLPPRPFHLTAHLDPLIGQWLEAGPTEGAQWPGFMAGTLGAEVTAFGVGPRGILPRKCTLERPLRGIRGDWGGREFSACATRNLIGADNACFLHVEGEPEAIFIAPYPEEDGLETRNQSVAYLELA